MQAVDTKDHLQFHLSFVDVYIHTIFFRSTIIDLFTNKMSQNNTDFQFSTHIYIFFFMFYQLYLFCQKKIINYTSSDIVDTIIQTLYL
jgi:hypothetical protein